MRAPHDRSPDHTVAVEDAAAAPGRSPRTARLTPPRGTSDASQPPTLAPAAAGPVPDMFDGILPKTSPDPDGAAAKPKVHGLEIRWHGTNEATYRAFFHAMTGDARLIDRWTAEVLAEDPRQSVSNAREAHQVGDDDVTETLTRLHKTNVILPPSVMAILSRITSRPVARLEHDAQVASQGDQARDRDEAAAQMMRDSIRPAASKLVGPDGVVAGGMSSFRMALSIGSEPNPNDALEELRQITDRCKFSWEVFDVSALAGTGDPEGAADPESAAATVAADQTAADQVAAGSSLAVGREATTADAHAHDLARVGHNLAADTRRAFDGTVEAMRADHKGEALGDFTTLMLTGASAVRNYGGHVIGRLLDDALGDHSERSIAFPSSGTFVVRCIAQPKTIDDANARQRSVALMVTHARSVSDVGRRALNAPAPRPEDSAEAQTRAGIVATGRPSDVIAISLDELVKQLAAATAARDEAGNQRDAARASGDANAAAGYETSYVRAVELRAALTTRIEQERTRLGHAQERSVVLGSVRYRPRATIVDTESGAKLDLLLEVGEPQGYALAQRTHLSDVTTSEGGLYDGRTETRREDAIWSAVHQFATLNSYGRGRLFVRFGDDAKLGPDSEREMESSPGETRLLRNRIGELTDVMMLVPGAGELVIVASAITASANLAQRMHDGTLRANDATLNDVLQVLATLTHGVKQVGALRLEQTTNREHVRLMMDVAGGIEHVSNAVQFVTTTSATIDTFTQIAAAEDAGTMSHKSAMEARLHALQGQYLVSSSLADGAVAADPMVASDVTAPTPPQPGLTEPRMVPGSHFAAENIVPRPANEVRTQATDLMLAVLPGVAGVTSVETTVDPSTFLVGVRGPEGEIAHVTIRMSAATLAAGATSNTVVNPVRVGTQRMDAATPSRRAPIDGRFVIQISTHLPEGQVQRAVVHELNRVVAERNLGATGGAPGVDVLVPGTVIAGASLSPRDHGRLGELGLLLAAEPTPENRHELLALIEHLGLRDGTPGAAERLALVQAALGDAAGSERLAELRRPDPQLAPADLETLGRIREVASVDRVLPAMGGAVPDPVHPLPVVSPADGVRMTPAERRAAAVRAAERRAEVSRQTIKRYWDDRAKLPEGQYPVVRDPMIGGGAALAGRRPEQLLVDARGRWQGDAADALAQTAGQVRGLRDVGFGDPAQFAAPTERVPIEALHIWEDTVAAQGDVIDGVGTLRIDADGRLLLDVVPNGGGELIVYQVDGTPVTATGFARERVPGMAFGMRPAAAISRVHEALGAIVAGPETPVRAEAVTLLAELAKHPGHPQDMAWLAQRLPPGSPLLAALLATPAGAEVKRAMTTATAYETWDQLRATRPDGSRPPVFLGDEANERSLRPDAADHWLVAGSGGTGISAAEAILRRNRAARVTMVGADFPAGLVENEQMSGLVRQHGDAQTIEELLPGDPLVARDPMRPDDPARNPRLEVRGGWRLDGPRRDDSHAQPEYVMPSSRGAERQERRGTGLIAALGREGEVPSSVLAMVYGALRHDPTSVWLEPLHDNDGDGAYLGYRIHVRSPTGAEHSVDVTGAASRTAPADLPTAGAGGEGPAPSIPTVSAASSDRDAPAEGASFDAGFLASANQSAAHARWRGARPGGK